MRYAILADIHSNLAAFSAVLDDIGRQGGVDRFWCLGDVVDYGPQPRECLEMLRQLDPLCVAGNHDLGAIGQADTALFNADAAIANQWTARQLSPRDVVYLGNLPLVIEEGDFTLVHGSPREPVWEYLFSSSVARENFAHFKTRYCLVGHSHIPVVFSYNEDGSCSAGHLQPSVKLALGRRRLIINPGSVGQPRDGNPEASYAIYDSEAGHLRNYRVPYDIQSTQDKIMAAGLPVTLAARLSRGV